MPALADITYITSSQLASLSTTNTGALRAKGIADDVKSGVLPPGGTAQEVDIKNVNNRVGAIALTATMWMLRTNDTSYLATIKAFIKGGPKPPSTVQGLNEFRSYGPLFAAVKLLRDNGMWDSTDENSSLPNYAGKTWATFMSDLPTRTVDTSTSQRASWRQLQTCAEQSPSNWGATAKWALLMWAVLMGNQTIVDESEMLMRKWLGESVPSIPDFFSSGTYLKSWDNVNTGTADGSNQRMAAGIGKPDSANPGLDAVIINDIDRGATNYSATAAYFGATSLGLTYPLENWEYVAAELVAFRNAGYPVETWGSGGNALERMSARFNVAPSGQTGTMFSSAEAGSGIYKNHRWVANAISSGTYGTPTAVASGAQNLLRSQTWGDWVGANGSTWGQIVAATPPAVGKKFRAASGTTLVLKSSSGSTLTIA